MPRRIFPASSVTNTTGAPIRLSFHYTQSGGQRATDLFTVDGSNYTSAGIPNGTVLTDASGNYSAFAGPDDVDTLWVAPHTGAARTQITATGTVANGTTVDSSTYARIIQLPHSLRKVGFIGDSITNGSAGGDTYTTTMTGIVENSDAPSTYAMLASNGQWDFIINAGIGGQRSDQIAARIPAEIIGNSCDICVLYSPGYTNDLGASFTTATTLANITGMVTTLLNAGVLPVLGTPTPQPTGASAAAKTWIQEVRRLVIALARTYNIPVVDLTPVLIDSSTGVLNSTYYTSDVHPNTAGRVAGGQAVAAVLNRICNGGWAGTCAVGDSDDILTGRGFFAADANSDGLADGWNRSGDVGPICSLITDGTIGRMQRVTTSGSSAAVNFLLNTFPTVVPGHVLEFSGYISKAGTSGPQIALTNTGMSRKFSIAGNAATNVTRGRFTYRYTLPATVPSNNIAFTLVVGAGTGTVDFGQITLRDMTALGIA